MLVIYTVIVLLLMTEFSLTVELISAKQPTFLTLSEFNVPHSDNGICVRTSNYSYKVLPIAQVARSGPVYLQKRSKTHRRRRSSDDHLLILGYYFKAYFEVLLYPVLGFLGLTGNVFTGIILKRSGLKKPTNILLLALAISSVCCLLPTLNIFSMLRHFNKKVPHIHYIWEFEAGKSGFAYFCYHATRVIFYSSRYGRQMTSSICVLITLERFIVVFFPMKVKRIINLKRTLAMVIVVHLIWVPYLILSLRASHAHVVYYQEADWFGLFIVYEEDFHLYRVNLITDVLSSFIPVTLIFFTTVAISVKLGFILRNRRRLTSSLRGAHSLGLSRTLIAVCVKFCLLHVTEFVFIIKSVSENESWLLGRVVCSLDYLDSASHFIVFIFLNRNFRVIIVKLIRKMR